jgi:hypothetical protein
MDLEIEGSIPDPARGQRREQDSMNLAATPFFPLIWQDEKKIGQAVQKESQLSGAITAYLAASMRYTWRNFDFAIRREAC